ncbi:uncharacterized protein M6D78_013475 [Vipera latastei]
MQLLLGLLLSILLTTGSSLKCEQCTAINTRCSGSKEECPYSNAVCMNLSLKVARTEVIVTMKRCSRRADCKWYEDQKGKRFYGDIINVSDESIIIDASCSKAPPSFASFFPAFLGLLLMKLLF